MSNAAKRLASRFVAYRAPVQDWAGYKTYVNPKSQKNLPTRKEREDSSDDPQALSDSRRDRAKPLPSGHPKGRDRIIPGPRYNTPGDSKPKDENNSKPTVPPRSPGKPGEEYGNPYKEDYHTVRRRILGGMEERFPKDRQKNQVGAAKAYYQRYYRENKQKIKKQRAEGYRKTKSRAPVKLDREYRDKYPDRYKRRGQGYRSNAERAQDRREKERLQKERNAGGDTFVYETEGIPHDYSGLPFSDRYGPQRKPAERPNITPSKGQTGPFRAQPSVNYDRGELADRHKHNRTAALLLSEIDAALSRQVRERSRAYTPTLLSKTGNEYHFQTGDWEQHVKLTGSRTNVLSKKLASMRCSCPFYRWQGPEHWSTERDYQHGALQGTAAFPGIRDPDGLHPICKHLAAVFRYIRKGEASVSKLASRYVKDNS